MARSWFTQDEISRVEAQVAGLERRSRGEVVPQVVFASDAYWEVHGFAGMAAAVTAFAGVEFARTYSPWAVPGLEALTIVVLAAILGGVLCFWSPIKRVLTPERLRTRRVREKALLSFLLMGLQETRDRTGVLIYLSLFEQQVEIIADRGIYSQVPAGHWDDIARSLTEAIRSGRPGEGLEQAVIRVGERLIERFPVAEGDRNEVPDRVVFGHPLLPQWGV
ncbi:MAG: hypothetical protein IT285_10345 [Bdellovibrionales bacterium]|nr:hypothetical protein [Bdellovibrionales bacterium]